MLLLGGNLRLTRALPTVLTAKGKNVATMTTPIGAHIRKYLKPMGYPMVKLLLIRVGLRVRGTDTFGDDLGITFLVTSVFAVLALHTSRVLQKISAKGASHDIVELLKNKFMAI